MKKNLITLLLIILFSSLGFSQIKRQFEDNKQNGRTVVVKEEGVTDQQILEQRFGDVRPGKVIRITMDKPPQTKAPKPKTTRTPPPPKPKVTPPPKIKKKAPLKPKEKPKKVTPPPPPRPQKYFGAGSSYKIKTKKKKVRKRKRFNSKEQRKCYGF